MFDVDSRKENKSSSKFRRNRAREPFTRPESGSHGATSPPVTPSGTLTGSSGLKLISGLIYWQICCCVCCSVRLYASADSYYRLRHHGLWSATLKPKSRFFFSSHKYVLVSHLLKVVFPNQVSLCPAASPCPNGCMLACVSLSTRLCWSQSAEWQEILYSPGLEVRVANIIPAFQGLSSVFKYISQVYLVAMIFDST